MAIDLSTSERISIIFCSTALRHFQEQTQTSFGESQYYFMTEPSGNYHHSPTAWKIRFLLPPLYIQSHTAGSMPDVRHSQRRNLSRKHRLSSVCPALSPLCPPRWRCHAVTCVTKATVAAVDNTRNRGISDGPGPALDPRVTTGIQ